MTQSNREEMNEILRQYDIDKAELAEAKRKYRHYLRYLPEMHSMAQEREKAYQFKIHSDAHKVFEKRRKYHDHRAAQLGYDLTFESKSKRLEIDDAYRNSPMMQEALAKLREQK